MTLKGHKNHYNIKLLRGYGVSINLKDNKIILKDGMNDITGRSEKEEWFVTQIPYEKIVISGKGYVSTQAIKLLSEKNINVKFKQISNKVLNMMPSNVKNFGISRRIKMILIYVIMNESV